MEKKDFITEIEKYRKLLKDSNFDKYLSKSTLYGYLNGKYDIEILDKYYKSLFDYSYVSILDSNVLDDLIKKLISFMQKYGGGGEPENIDAEYDVSLATNINIVTKFIDELIPEYKEHFMDIMSNRFYLLNEIGSSYESSNDDLKLYDSNSIATCYVLLHELIHSENGGDYKNHYWTFEVPSYASEFFLNDYIKGYFKNLEGDSNLWLRARLSDDVEVLCGYIFLRKLKEYLNKEIPINRESISILLEDISSEFNVSELYVFTSTEKFFFVAKKYSDLICKIKDSDIEDITIEQFKKDGIKKYDKDIKKTGRLYGEGYTLILRCIQHAIGATLGFKLYQNMYDNDYDTKEFRKINANIHNYSVEDLLTILSLKDKNGYNKDEINNMKEAFQKRLKRLDNE